MTDLFPPDDEMISSYLDGEATPGEVARIEADPELAARVSLLRAAARFSARPVHPLEAEVVDDLVAAALDAGGLPHNVTDLATARRRVVPRALLAAAAAVVLVALAVPAIRLISNSTGSSNSTTASAPAAPIPDAGSPGEALSAKSLDRGDGVTAATTTAAAAATAESSAMATDTADEVGGSDFAPAETTPYVIPGFPPFDPSVFDPLPDVMESVPDMATLRQDLALVFSGERSLVTGVLKSRSSPAVDPARCAGSLTDFLKAGPVGAEIANSAAVSDFATVSIDGVTNLVALVRISPTRAVAFVVDAATCSPVTQLDIVP